MKPLADILIDLSDTDLVLGQLRDRVEADPDDQASRVNIDALAKRRRDLERRLDDALRNDQLDLVTYGVERDNGTAPPASIAAHSLVLFQEVITAIFDAIRDAPKRQYAPLPENAALSAMSFAAAPADSRAMALAIPNDRLLTIRSDLDLTFELAFGLLRLRSANDARQFGERTGVSSLVKLHQWAEHAAEQRLTITIGWQKSSESSQSTGVSGRDAQALQRTIEATTEDRVEELEIESQLLSLDETRGTFRLQISDTERIEGSIDDAFPRGKSWTINGWLVALLTRSTRLSYAWGTERVRWTLRRLIQLD